MSYNLRGNSVIASYRTFIHCGILSCKVSCEKNSLQCEVCLKHFHYKCIKITEREYDDIKSRNLTFVCGVECYNAIFPFFSLKQIDFLNTLVDDGTCPYPCKKCKKPCIGNQLMDCIQCDVCDKWLHRDCANLEYDFDDYINSSIDFICSPRCQLSVLPFSSVFKSIKIDEFHPFRDNFPCKLCRNDCLGFGIQDSIQCDSCLCWLHIDCANLSVEEFENYANSDKQYICNKRCEIFYLYSFPFQSESTISLETLATNCSLPTELPNFVVARPCLEVRNFVRRPISNRLEKVKSSESVYFDKFLDVNCSYLDPNELGDHHLASNKSSEFTIFHNNIRSISKNFNEIETDLFLNCTQYPDIMAFTDTRLIEGDKAPALEGYTFEGTPSPSRNAGGAGFYLSNSIQYSVSSEYSLNEFKCEDLWLNLKVNSKSKSKDDLVLGVIYRHNFVSNYDQFTQKFCDILLSLNERKKNYYIVGDFNINLMKFNLAGNVTKYMNAISCTGCGVFINQPTRDKNGSISCLDHVYSNLPTENLTNYIILSDITDHFATLTKINGISRNFEKEEVLYRKTNLTDLEWENLNCDLDKSFKDNIPFPNLLNAQHLASSITDCYQTIVDKHMPLKKISKKQNARYDKPWITLGFKTSIKKRKDLLNAYIKTGCIEDEIKYKSYLNKLTHLKDKARKKYYKDKSELYGQDKAKAWQLINEISNRKRKKGSSIKSIKNKNGNVLSDSTDIANCFNEHFGTIGETMAKKFSTLDQSRFKDPLSFISKEMKNSFLLSNTNMCEISILFSKLNGKKSGNPVSNHLLKGTRERICPYLDVLFNKCINEGVFPDTFKTAEVIPLFKGGDREDLGNYRPISLLPAIGKLFEKLLASRIIKFFIKYELFSPAQFGFRAGFATDYAIADIYEKLVYNLDKDTNSCAIFLDLAKAFDSVSHEILLRKMHQYGIRGKPLELFRSYLKSRHQYVKLNGVKSSLIEIKFGVPQGSILGPLLFLIFINDLPDATNFFIKLFADDTFLCTQNDDFVNMENEVNIELEKVFVWLASNKLTLNTDKSKFMILSKRREIPNLSIKMNGVPLESCNSYKYLGVIFDKNLEWGPHIDYISKKISKACGALAKLRHCVNIDMLRNVYHALIHSYVRYGILVWGNALQSKLEPLKVLVNKSIRIMAKLPFGSVELNPVFKELKLLKLHKIHMLETGKFIFKEKNGLLPTRIGNYFEVTSAEIPHHHFVRHERSPRFICNSSTGEKSLQFNAFQLWKNMPTEFKNIESYKVFKRTYKKYLIDLDG